jgi:hypothetical protein
MSRTVRRVGLVAVVLGLIAGIVAAIAVPHSTGRAAPRATATTPPRAATGPITTAPARPQPGGPSRIALRRTGPYAVAARVDDPAGGPPWVVRTFLAERSSLLRGRRHVVGRNRCFQLGRLHGGRFGWLDDRSVFRPVTAGYRGAPIQCGSRLPDLHRQPTIDGFHVLDRGADGRGWALNTVTWAVAGAAARDIVLRLPGGARGTVSGRWNVGIAIQGPDLDATAGGLRVRYASGRIVERSADSRDSDPFDGRAANGPDPAATPFIAARAPDPNGGRPFGLAAVRASDGGWCIAQQPGRIVGDRVGRINFELGTFVEAMVMASNCAPPDGVGRRRPFMGGYGSAMEDRVDGADPAPGRIARRTLPGMQYFSGRVPGDVRSLTFTSPRDVRTLVPSSPAHAYLVVYDGAFSAGVMRIVARFAVGSTAREEHPLGF